MLHSLGAHRTRADSSPNRRRPLFKALQRAFHDPAAPSYKWVERTVWFLIALSFVLISIELRTPDVPPPAWVSALDIAVLWAFVLEYVLRVGTFGPPELRVLSGSRRFMVQWHIVGRLRFMLRPLMQVDLLSILAVVPALRGLRALRLLRLFRGIQLFRYSSPLRGVTRALQENALVYAFNVAFLLGNVLVGGISLFLVERGSNPNINSLADGLWWSLVTITTVGFGDITPITPLGRFIGGTVMVTGMFTLALFAGTVGGTLLRTLMTLREDSFRMVSYTDHIVVCGYDSSADLLLEALVEELGPSAQSEIMVFAPGERPSSLRPEFLWVSGDPSKESELDKCRLPFARATIVIGSRSVPINQADAETILVVFTLRAYLAKAETASRRQRPLHVIAEILDPENRNHARTAGADEVVETTRFGFSLIAHAAVVPGSGNIMSRVAAAGAHSLYIGTNPMTEPDTYGHVSEAVRQAFGVVVIGMRSGKSGNVELNPPDGTTLLPSDAVVYLARSAVLPEPSSNGLRS